jgi:hypothetical protein
MANNSIALRALLAGSLLLPFACKGASESAGLTADGTPIGSVATPLHGPCIDWAAGGVPPVPTALASNQDSPWAIAADRTNVYWTEVGGVMTMPASGDSPHRLAQSSSATALAVDSDNLYWADATGVSSVPLGGGPQKKLFSGPTDTQGLAVDSRHVYWTDSAAGTVMRVPRTGGTATTVATGEHQAAGIAADGTRVVWATGQPGAIEMVPLSGGFPVSLASAQSAPQQVALDGLNVYWTNGGAGATLGSVMEAPLAGGAPIALAAGQTDPQGIAAAGVQGAGTYVYWVDGAGGALMATPAIGGFQPTVLARGLGHPERIAVGADRLFWTDNASGNVMELACSRENPALDGGADGSAEPGDASGDATVVGSSDDADNGGEDATGLACQYFAPSDGVACAPSVRPVCLPTLVGQEGFPPPDASIFWTGGSIVAGTYFLTGWNFVEYAPNASCPQPIRAITQTVLFIPTDVASGTEQIDTILQYSIGTTSSETAAETYTTSGSTITETSRCPDEGAPMVGSYVVTSTQLMIRDEADGSPCGGYTVRVYTRLPSTLPPFPSLPDDSGMTDDGSVDAKVTVDAGGP